MLYRHFHLAKKRGSLPTEVAQDLEQNLRESLRAYKTGHLLLVAQCLWVALLILLTAMLVAKLLGVQNGPGL